MNNTRLTNLIRDLMLCCLCLAITAVVADGLIKDFNNNIVEMFKYTGFYFLLLFAINFVGIKMLQMTSITRNGITFDIKAVDKTEINEVIQDSEKQL